MTGRQASKPLHGHARSRPRLSKWGLTTTSPLQKRVSAIAEGGHCLWRGRMRPPPNENPSKDLLHRVGRRSATGNRCRRRRDGFVGAKPPSPRTLADNRIAEIAALAPPFVATVLLTSERTADAISAHIRRTHPTTVQVLPHIDPAEWAQLAEREPHIRRLQVIHVEGPERWTTFRYMHPMWTPSFSIPEGQMRRRRNSAVPADSMTGW